MPHHATARDFIDPNPMLALHEAAPHSYEAATRQRRRQDFA